MELTGLPETLPTAEDFSADKAVEHRKYLKNSSGLHQPQNPQNAVTRQLIIIALHCQF